MHNFLILYSKLIKTLVHFWFKKPLFFCPKSQRQGKYTRVHTQVYEHLHATGLSFILSRRQSGSGRGQDPCQLCPGQVANRFLSPTLALALLLQNEGESVKRRRVPNTVLGTLWYPMGLRKKRRHRFCVPDSGQQELCHQRHSGCLQGAESSYLIRPTSLCPIQIWPLASVHLDLTGSRPCPQGLSSGPRLRGSSLPAWEARRVFPPWR